MMRCWGQSYLIFFLLIFLLGVWGWTLELAEWLGLGLGLDLRSRIRGRVDVMTLRIGKLMMVALLAVGAGLALRAGYHVLQAEVRDCVFGEQGTSADAAQEQTYGGSCLFLGLVQKKADCPACWGGGGVRR